MGYGTSYTASPLGGSTWVYVGVESETLRSGLIIPHAIIWPDGRRFEISKIVEMQKSFENGFDGTPWVYQVMIGSHKRTLWHVPPRWRVLCSKGGVPMNEPPPEIDFYDAHKRYGLRW